MKKYVHLLAWALYPDPPGGHDVLVDYGGGHGFMACLAKEAGFRRVIYNDIFAGCCEDARKLALHLGCVVDEYICGDILAISGALRERPAASLALVSINVIEHIYDMDKFIQLAGALSSGPTTLALSTSANPLNPLVAHRHYRQHRLWEFTDGPHESCYPLDTTRAFRAVRRDIIKDAAPQLSEAEVESLVDNTRGMWKPDVEKCVHAFLATGQMPSAPAHPTNTCDPLTGSWQERLLDIPEVRRTLEKAGFSVHVRGGYYNDSSRRAAKRAAAWVLNHAISLLGSEGARLAPSFMFHAARR